VVSAYRYRNGGIGIWRGSISGIETSLRVCGEKISAAASKAINGGENDGEKACSGMAWRRISIGMAISVMAK